MQIVTTTSDTAAGMAPPRPADSCTMVIFGASGDLTKRKLIPALYNLAHDNLLSRQFALVGLATRGYDTNTVRSQLEADLKEFSAMPVDPEIWEWLARRIYYVRGSLEDAATYVQLRETVTLTAAEHGVHDNLFHYLAVAPKFFGGIVRQLDAVGLARESDGKWRRVIVEKPFGPCLRDTQQAQSFCQFHVPG